MVWFARPERFAASSLAALVTEVAGGDLHVVLAPEPVWLDEAETAGTRRELARLRAAYGGVRDRDEPGLAELARLLSTPPEARYGWISDLGTGGTLAVLAAVEPRFGLVAVREKDDVWIRTFRDEDPGRQLASTLPEWWKSTAPALTFLRAEWDPCGFVDDIEPSPAVRQARRITALPPRMVAELYAETRPPDGSRRSSRIPIRVQDTDEGRWMLTARPHHGDELLTLAPAGDAEVLVALAAARRELA
ncbi:ESX secretion-associated protein EspG [Amycolatopsis antarctica]|uniref:ESX secretion-associated protein EspG n=1 Tax=Amycolatopsis antarctica TaxID=1854586 RepID=A0A263D443_9PSEU|nr:ESX secretion-associated protein EspG [Amycolatopsis antarctica]OZM73210.1 ESX secretion-associated protein EspG [Amycolatopsis antarctica]